MVSAMNFGGFAVHELDEMRKMAESLFRDTAKIERVSREAVEDGLGGATFPRTTIYEGPVKVQSWQPYEQAPEAGGHTYVTQRYNVHAPWDAGPFQAGDIVTITSSTHAAHAVGAVYRIAGLHEKSIQTAQRFLVDEVVT